MEKVQAIALVDVNSFFASAERAFDPSLENRALIILSNNDGCAVTRTAEAKALGIKMGDPWFKLKHLASDKIPIQLLVTCGILSRAIRRISELRITLPARSRLQDFTTNLF